MRTSIVLALSATFMSQVAVAAETITYSYDAKGRLIKVVHSGPVNGAMTTTYEHDKADNRRRLTNSGAPR